MGARRHGKYQYLKYIEWKIGLLHGKYFNNNKNCRGGLEEETLLFWIALAGSLRSLILALCAPSMIPTLGSCSDQETDFSAGRAEFFPSLKRAYSR